MLLFLNLCSGFVPEKLNIFQKYLDQNQFSNMKQENSF